MAILKVKQGDRIPFIVTGLVRDVPASNPKYGPSHKFVGRTPTDPDAAVFMAPASAERQVARHGWTLDTVVGKAIVFARPGEYVDIEPYVAEGTAQPALAPAPTAPAPTPKPASNARQPFSAGPHIPGLDAPRPPAPAAVAAVAVQFVTRHGEHVGCDTNDPASLEAWFGNFGHAEHLRKVVLATARETERAKANERNEKVSETRLDDLARTSDSYVQFLIDTLNGRHLRERNVLTSLAR